jgi:hypothetical protein
MKKYEPLVTNASTPCPSSTNILTDPFARINVLRPNSTPNAITAIKTARTELNRDRRIPRMEFRKEERAADSEG